MGRADFMVEKGKIRTMVEVKNGPTARFTPNQALNYPLVEQGRLVVPFGKNATRSPIGTYKFRVIKY